MTAAPPPDHPAIPPRRIGVLIVNLGTPDAPESGAVRRYLREFLSDRRVVEVPPVLWQPILRGLILPVRPGKSAHAYRQIWTDRGSPLAVHTRDTAEELNGRFGGEVLVDWAMRYGNPSIGERLAAMKAAGCDRVLIAPLYPQYSAATTGTANEAAFRALGEMRWQPAVRTLPPYHDDPAYIAALRASIEGQLAALPFAPERLLLSFHGMPERTLRLGDPYHCHAMKTARLLSEALGRETQVTFQSRFGRAKWLEPATDATLARLAGEGVRSVAVATPGFAADCLETLEEIAIRGAAIFRAHGGTDFASLSCINATSEAMALYENLISRELLGWRNS